MKALYKDGKSRFGLVERARPRPRRDDVLIRVDSAAICHTDILIRDGAAPHGVDTFIPGHEFSGVVVECGEDVPYMAVGDRGVVQQIVGCNRCGPCRMGNVHECRNFEELGVKSDGGFAEFCAVPARNFHKLPDDISLEEGALCEPLANAVSAVSRAKIEPTERVLVIGPGAIGLLCVQVANLYGPAKIILAGRRNDVRLEAAKKVCGRALTVNTGSAEGRKILKDDLLEGEGADVVLECSGTSNGFALALEVLAPGGRVCCEGSVGKNDVIAFSPALLVPNRSILGISGWEPRDFQRAVNLITRKMITIRPLVTHRFSLEEWQKGFEMATERKSESIRVLLKPQGA